MATFKDKAGRAWVVELDWEAADRVQAEHGIDLIDPDKIDRAYLAIAFNPRALLAVVWAMCQAQAQRDGVSKEDFTRAIGPAQLGPMLEAVKETVADFSPCPELADAKRKAFRAIVEVTEEQAPGLIDRNLSRAKESARSAMNSPASAGSATSAT